jgi:small subunit ribosomal protein S4
MRLVRREGMNLFGNEKFDANKIKKNYKPGMHGPKGSFSKKSEYARQLREKQRLKIMFGITERQLFNYYKKASTMKEVTGNALLKLLEKRLDSVIFKAGLAKSRPQARQMVSHGLFKVNNQKVNVPSFQVSIGDKFEAIARLKKSKLFENLEKQKFAPAKWVKVDYKTISGEMTREIEPQELEQGVQASLVIEYYSKA